MTELSHRVQYFLGANSAEGFSSLYGQWVDQKTIQAFYVIKGGAGCGKSTLMSHVAAGVEEKGYQVEYIRCSGDPDSLDGIFIQGKGAALVDGTAPHAMDPAFTGATGHYIDLGAGYDRRALFLMREDIIAAAQAYQGCYPLAYRCIRGAEESLRRGRQPLWTETALAKAEKRAEGILGREAKKKSRGVSGKCARRFLSGVTCQGRILLGETVDLLCERGYEIRDDAGLAGHLLKRLEAGFLERGYDVIACPDPVSPRRLAHLLVPERSLAFVTGPVEGRKYKTIRTESLTEKTVWREGRSFLRLSERVAEELLAEACGHLAQAKAHHDELEELYHPHIDFSLCREMTGRITTEILSLPDVTG